MMSKDDTFNSAVSPDLVFQSYRPLLVAYIAS